MVSQVTTKGMSKEEKLGIAAGAVAFIVVLLFFLVIGNMSVDATQPTPPIQPIQPVQPVEPIQPEQPIQPVQPVQPVQPIQPIQPAQVPAPQVSAPGVGMGELFMTVGGLLLLVGLLYLARRFGWLYLEPIEPTSDELLLEGVQEVRHQRAPLLDRGQLDGEVEKLTRELKRRQVTLQRLAEERNKASGQVQLLRETLALDEEASVAEAVKQLQQKLAAALKAKKELTARLSDCQNFEEVTEEELEAFWPTLLLDKKPYMSKRRQQRLLARMSAENMKWMRIAN